MTAPSPARGWRSGRRLARALVAGVVITGLTVTAPASADYYAGLSAYEDGDFISAARELQPAAEQGDSRAQRLLGLLYRDGRGVLRDDVSAYVWLHLAAAAGEPRAAAERDRLAWKLEADDLDRAQRLASAWRPGRAIAATAPSAPAAAPTADYDLPELAGRPLDRQQVADLQWQLALHGYDPGPADGVAGPRTRAAIARYQADAGLPVDGEPSLALLDHVQYAEGPRQGQVAAQTDRALPPLEEEELGPPPDIVGDDEAETEALPEPERQPAAAGDVMDVYTRAIQQALARQGYYHGPIDGVLNGGTREAIRRYQSRHGLPETGEVSLELVNHVRLIAGAT